MKVTCTLLKLARGPTMQLARVVVQSVSTISVVVHNICRVINLALRHEINWSTRQ